MSIKKYTPYILILIIVLVGLFSPMIKVSAVTPAEQTAIDNAKANAAADIYGIGGPTTEASIDASVKAATTPEGTAGLTAAEAAKIEQLGAQAGTESAGAAPATPVVAGTGTEKSEFDKWAREESCGIIGESSVAGCTKALFYYIVYTPSAFFLTLAAKFFNALIKIALDSTMISGSTFISTAWAVVRDLSNMFFILILLYIAIKIILGLGGSEVKKMIAKVIIFALLINFSMFFTQVIIDSSNILALIFYNKLDTTYKDPKTGQPITRPDTPTTPGEKEISGSMYSSFDLTTKLNNPTFWENVKGKNEAHVPVGTMIGIICVAAGIMLFAAYAFFISGIAFVARLIELWILIIFSPFAFMSSTVPLFSGIEYLGWDAWFKRLLKVAFMAPIFMFFMYLIFLLLQPPGIFGNLTAQAKESQTWVQTILFAFIPAMVLMILLLRATKYAKEGSGAIGEALMKGAKVVGGLALGATVGGAAIAGRATVGRMGASMANSKWAQRWESHGFGGEYARRAAAAVGGGSFDVRGAKIGGKTLASATGMNVGEAQKGGFTERRKADVEKRLKRAKDLEVKEDQPEKQALNELEAQKQGLMLDVSHDIEQLDNRLKVWRERAADTARAARLNATGDSGLRDATGAILNNTQANILAENNLGELRQHRNAIKNGVDFTPTAVSAINPAHAGNVQNYSTRTRVGGVATGASINELEDNLIPQAHHAIQHENRRIRGVYANTTESGLGRIKNALFTLGQSSHKGSREASHNIRMETKIEDKGGH